MIAKWVVTERVVAEGLIGMSGEESEGGDGQAGSIVDTVGGEWVDRLELDWE